MNWTNSVIVAFLCYFVFFTDYLAAEKSICPKQCACALLTVVCTGQSLESVPKNIPPGTIRL